MWTDQPNKPGYWLFIGKRITRSRKHFAEVAAPCEIKDDPGYKKLVAFYPGSGLAYDLSQHNGKWFFLGDLLNDGKS